MRNPAVLFINILHAAATFLRRNLQILSKKAKFWYSIDYEMDDLKADM